MKKLLFSVALIFAVGILHAQSTITLTNSTSCGVSVLISADDPSTPCGPTYSTVLVYIPVGGSVYYDLTGSNPAPWYGSTPPSTASFIFTKVVSTGLCGTSGIGIGEVCTGGPQTGSFTVPCSPTCSTINASWSGSYGNPISVSIY